MILRQIGNDLVHGAAFREMQGAPIDGDLSCADAEEAAEIDDGRPHHAFMIHHDVDNATHVIAGRTDDRLSKNRVRCSFDDDGRGLDGAWRRRGGGRGYCLRGCRRRIAAHSRPRIAGCRIVRRRTGRCGTGRCGTERCWLGWLWFSGCRIGGFGGRGCVWRRRGLLPLSRWRSGGGLVLGPGARAPQGQDGEEE